MRSVLVSHAGKRQLVVSGLPELTAMGRLSGGTRKQWHDSSPAISLLNQPSRCMWRPLNRAITYLTVCNL